MAFSAAERLRDRRSGDSLPARRSDEEARGARTPIMTRCPECESDLELDGYELDVGETMQCPECSVELRIVSVEPVSVALAETEEEG